jgi:hypothetical protein
MEEVVVVLAAELRKIRLQRLVAVLAVTGGAVLQVLFERLALLLRRRRRRERGCHCEEEDRSHRAPHFATVA